MVTHADDPKEVRWYRSVDEVGGQADVPSSRRRMPIRRTILAWGKATPPDIVLSFSIIANAEAALAGPGSAGGLQSARIIVPEFRGRAPINWAIIEGRDGNRLDAACDGGKARRRRHLVQERVPIDADDTAKQVFEKLVPSSRRLLTQVLPLLREGRAPRTPQNAAEATYFGARRPEDGRIDWRWPARRVHNMVRALTRPYPGAFTEWNGRKLFIWKGHVRESPAEGTPACVGAASAEGVPVSTGDGTYLVKEVQWDGGPIQPAAEVLTPALQLDVFEPPAPAKSLR